MPRPSANDITQGTLPKISHGRGVYLWDAAGRQYIDGSGGPAVFSIGHGDPRVNEAVAKQRDTTRAALLRSLDREATQAFQRQNLDLAIAKWDRILEVDPANRKARLERERAADLKKRMNEKFGAK